MKSKINQLFDLLMRHKHAVFKGECKIIPKNAENVNQFLDFLNKRNKKWYSDSLKQNCWIYRGQWEEKTLTLSPKSLRENLGLENNLLNNELLDEVLPNQCNIRAFSKNLSEEYKTKIIKLFDIKNRSFDDTEVIRLKMMLTQSMLEHKLIKKFILTCNRSALFIEDTEIKIKNAHNNKLIEMDEAISLLHSVLENWLKYNLEMEDMHCEKSYTPLFEYESYHPIALGQHSGISTRLLDWTHNSLIAAFFAEYASLNSKNINAEICVYALNTQYQNEISIYPNSLRIHSNIKHNKFEFLHMQEGILTEMRGADFYFLKHGKWPSLEDHIMYFDEKAATSGKPYNLEKICLPGKFANELLHELALENITKATLMPTYFHCADSILKK